MSEHLLLIDGNGFIFRAHHGSPAWRRRTDDMNLGAVKVFSEMMWAIYKRSLKPREGVEQPATHIIVVLDHKSPNFRHRLFPAYKANRPPTPPDLQAQLPLVRQAVKAFGLPCIEMEGHEADDIIATFARQAAEQVIDTTIISVDKDLTQLVGPLVKIWNPVKKKLMDANAVCNKYGVWPEEMGDFLAILGDAVDNVPGLPGVGEKGAAALLEKFGSIEEMIRRVDEIEKPKQREAVRENAEALRLSRKLVALNQEVPLTIDWERAAVRPPNRLDVRAFLRRMTFRTFEFEVVKFLDEMPRDFVRGEERTVLDKMRMGGY